MKVGCTAWAFTYPGYGAPYEDAIRAVGELGFAGVELILYSEEDLLHYYTPARIAELRRLYRSYGLTLSEFALYDSVVGDLASLEPERKARALENFARGAAIARELGTDTLNMVAQWPRGLKGPTPYPPHVIYTQVRGQEKFSPKLELELPPDFNWEAIWRNYVDSIRTCTQIAADHNLRFALEGHTHVIVPHTDSFLRLFDHVPHAALGTNFDTGWQFMQREYLPMSIHKLGQKIFHVHAKDSDGLLNYSLPPGLGIIDWDGVVDALHAVGFDGFLSLEVGRLKDPQRWLEQARVYLEGVIAAHGYA